MLKDDVILYSQLTGKDGLNVPIGIIGAYLDGYEKGKASTQPEVIYCGDCKYKDDGIDENGIPFLKCLHGRSYGGTRINDFCSWAEKKEDVKLRWIPCEERLPEEDKDVLCKTLAGVIFVASYGKLHQWTDEKGWIITPSLERAGISFVDEWMPLPEFKKGD